MMFVRDLAPAEKLELYKRMKGYSIFNGVTTAYATSGVWDQKIKDVKAILDEEMAVDYMEVYKDYSYGRY